MSKLVYDTYIMGKFVDNITIIDEWECSGEKFRLVNYGAGPDRLEINKCGNWERERDCYSWSIVTNRIKSLKKLCNMSNV